MVYLMSDIHGNTRRFDSVIKQINLRPEDTLYILGDVVDRHPDGIALLKRIMNEPQIKMILGNHEYMMLCALDPLYQDYSESKEERLDAIRLWYHNGGMVTHEAIQKETDEDRESVFEYLRRLPLNIDISVNETNYKLVHGFPVEMYESYAYHYRNETMFTVWKRYRGFDYLPADCVVVFGHTPTCNYQKGRVLHIYRSKLTIGLDCGSGFPDEPSDAGDYQGRLACLCLDTGDEFYSEEVTGNDKG